MDMSYLPYCFADPQFYDQPSRAKRGAGQQQYTLPRSVSWDGWTQQTSDGWHYVTPAGAKLPEQGWKIHASATLENANTILAEVADYCGRREIPFKFLPGKGDFMRANMKYASRSGSGKFITIYPADDAACQAIVEDLDQRIGGHDGPYILSDLRYSEGPLYLRYGGFAPMFVRDDDDRMVPAIRRPDGELEPDRREPTFLPPAWLDLPDFVRAQAAALGGSERPEEFPYQVIEALHFSNGGGIYRAKDLTNGAEVVLKEGRPHAGVGPDGVGAEKRLHREARFLDRLSDMPAVVTMDRTFACGGHEFLVEELVEGVTLQKELVVRSPLIKADSGRRERLAYRDWVLGVLGQVSDAVEEFHRRGVVFGDLHPNNVMVTPQDDARFIDFEMAYEVGETDVIPAGAPGFVAEDGRTGIDADRYSLGCMKLGMFVPLTVLLPLDPDKLHSMVATAQELFELGDEFCHSIIKDVALPEQAEQRSTLAARVGRLRDEWPISDASGREQIEAAIARGLDDSVDLSRADRVHPGDIRQFSEGGFGIASGACGVLLAHPDSPHREEILDWVVDAIGDLRRPSFGFYDGLAGAAWTLRQFGRTRASEETLDRLLEGDLSQLTGDLYSGLAGIGIMLMDLDAELAGDGPATHTSRSHAHETIRGLMQERLTEPRDGIVRQVNGQATVAVDRGGLLHGMTGQALYWIRSFERTGQSADLDRAKRALDQDIDLLVSAPDGSLQLNEGWRVLPYLGTGAIGVALAAMRYLQHRQDPDLVDVVVGVERNLTASFAAQSNLFNGRAGFVYFARRLLDSGLAKTTTPAEVDRQSELLGIHALTHKAGMVFPGEQLMRLSADWATGSAGVLATLRLIDAESGVGVPQDFRYPMVGIDPLGAAGQRFTSAQRDHQGAARVPQVA